MTAEIVAVVVVVPVHDEALLLDRCLTALTAAVAAARAQGVQCEVRIVLDDCADDSASIAATHALPTTVTSAARVGVARARGVEDALQQLPAIARERVWIANTDADSAVPPGWILEQCRLADAGADVFIGTVRPDFADLTPAHRQLWRRTHLRGEPNGHVHGASLGMRASVYLAAGGFDPVPEHEDVALVARARQLGAVTVPSDAVEVVTSGRFVGRTPGGYAGHLRAQAEMLRRGALTPETSS